MAVPLPPLSLPPPLLTMSSSELAPRRLAPCTEAQAASPAAMRPGTTASGLPSLGRTTSPAGVNRGGLGGCSRVGDMVAGVDHGIATEMFEGRGLGATAFGSSCMPSTSLQPPLRAARTVVVGGDAAHVVVHGGDDGDGLLGHIHAWVGRAAEGGWGGWRQQ